MAGMQSTFSSGNPGTGGTDRSVLAHASCHLVLVANTNKVQICVNNSIQ